ncbi:GNAT family acetyltransferase [Pedobacter psychrophilus]|uniref:GNAT family acetyltransferase n=1 Tax=Pedobacter psychrophilus TaxID=1826909 RepID=A0A179DL57_9SPHI|nr:GNAT family N-acetyltransferase [Pedobacter psychrophilus]OAQ41827.1 GNAT family acetyltransferase [Pedobacter psychrophilus]
MNCIKTDANHQDFKSLVILLDKYLHQIDGDEHSFYAQFNKIDFIKHVVICYDADTPIGCGAIKEYIKGVYEVKRMFVVEDYRGKGVASIILKELENWTTELGFTKCVLETGKKQESAIKLYQKNGYKLIPNYGQYVGILNSVCMEKDLNK